MSQIIFILLFVLLVILALVLSQSVLIASGGSIAGICCGGSELGKVRVIGIDYSDTVRIRNAIQNSAADLIMVEGVDMNLGINPSIEHIYGNDIAQVMLMAAIDAAKSADKDWCGAEDSYENYIKHVVKKYGKQTVMESLFYRELSANAKINNDHYNKIIPAETPTWEFSWALIDNVMANPDFHDHMRRLFAKYGWKYTEQFGKQTIDKTGRKRTGDVYLDYGEPNSFFKTLVPTQQVAKCIVNLGNEKIIENIAKQRQSYRSILCIVGDISGLRLPVISKKVK